MILRIRRPGVIADVDLGPSNGVTQARGPVSGTVVRPVSGIRERKVYSPPTAEVERERNRAAQRAYRQRTFVPRVIVLKPRCVLVMPRRGESCARPTDHPGYCMSQRVLDDRKAHKRSKRPLKLLPARCAKPMRQGDACGRPLGHAKPCSSGSALDNHAATRGLRR